MSVMFEPFSFQRMQLNILSAKRRSFGLRLNMVSKNLKTPWPVWGSRQPFWIIWRRYSESFKWTKKLWCMMTSSNGNIFRVTGHLCGEFPGDRWIPLTKASDAELWCFLWSVGWINNREAGDLRRHCAHYDVTVMGKVLSLCNQRCVCWLQSELPDRGGVPHIWVIKRGHHWFK